jgi:hypothetical protein
MKISRKLLWVSGSANYKAGENQHQVKTLSTLLHDQN